MGAALTYWKAVVEDRVGFLEGIIELLDGAGVRYCVIGGVGVNAYAEPLVTQDLDMIIAIEDMARARAMFEARFKVREFPYTWNVYDPGSKLQVQVQLREEMAPYVDRAQRREVMDLWVPVASPEDLIRAKSEAALEPTRRPSKRLKDVLDLARLTDAFPELFVTLPEALKPRVAEARDTPI